jgi:hypothetical protein
MFAASAQSETYRCPGEDYSITRSVHLARLAAFYAKCRDCPHAAEGTGAAWATEDAPEPRAPAGGRPSIFVEEGVRGRYLNEITRGTAERLAAALASCLWDDFVEQASTSVRSSSLGRGVEGERGRSLALSLESDARSAVEGVRVLETGRSGPRVVIAHDERPSSPDLVIGAGQALRRMGCQVVDIGLATRPCFLFAVNHLQAAGGVLVTGAGCDPGWAGLEFVSRGNVPCSSAGAIDKIADRFRARVIRPSRHAGSQRTFQALLPYEAGFAKHFHALRPLAIALACPSRTLRELFSRAFREVACRLIPVETPTRLRNLEDPRDPDLARTARTVRERRADLGVLVEEDGEQCLIFDERSEIVPPCRVFALLCGSIEDVAGPLVVPREWADATNSPLPPGEGPGARGAEFGRSPRAAQYTGRIFLDETSRERVTQATHAHRARLAADGRGRYWFWEGISTCDALLTLVRLLQALSQSDAPLSQVKE